MKKKSGMVRMILDGRRGNKRLRPAPSVSFASAESFAAMEVVAPQEFTGSAPAIRRYLSSLGIHVGQADIRDCLHRIKIPLVLARLYSLKPIRAEQLGLVGMVVETSVYGGVRRSGLVQPVCRWVVRGLFLHTYHWRDSAGAPILPGVRRTHH